MIILKDDKTIRTNGGKPVKYRSRMEDYAK